MVMESRSATLGNQRADLTKIRQGLSSLSPAVQATMRNAVPRNGSTPGRDEVKGTDSINQFKLERLSNIISNNINAVSDLRAITPYIDKGELIWNTILLYPNGKQNKLLTYDTQNTRYKNTALHQNLLHIWDEYFTNDYKIEQDLGHWINDILWNTGSVALFNLSRPGLDYLINGSEVDPKQSRAGNEEFQAKANTGIADHFVKTPDGGYVAKNIGSFVRNPNDKGTVVGGLEALLSGRGSYYGTEFNIFDGMSGKDHNDPKKPDVKLSDLINITLTDNPSILYLQKFNEESRQRDVMTVVGAESIDNYVVSAFTAKEERDKKKLKKPEAPQATTQNLDENQLEELTRQIFPGRNVRSQSMQYVKSLDTLSVQPYGRGLTFHIPSSAVVPIHYNGRNRQKIDYIVLMDEEGNFLTTQTDDSYYQSSSLKAANRSPQDRPMQGSTDQLISSLRTVQQGKPCDFDMSEFAELARSSIVKRWIQAAVSGAGDNISINLDEETNKIFLSRIFRKQGVRCLYVPGDAMTYIAFKHNNIGVGQSLTGSAKLHIARLAAFDFADALANLEAAQPHSLMTITPEKVDSDPHNTAAMARAKFFAANPRLHNLLSSAQLSLPQIADALRESSLTVKVNAGDNPNMPAPDINLQRMDKEHFKPVDDSSRQKVLNDISNYFHLPRSWLDVSDESNNFQIEAITEHQMVHNQAANWQSMLAEGVIDFERKNARVNGPFMQRLVDEILENKNLWVPDSKEKIEAESDSQIVKIILADFFSSIFCTLPEASSTDSTNKIKDRLEAVTALVEAWETMSGNTKVLEQMFKSLGLTSEKYSAEEIKASVKSVFLTEAFRKFNLPMPFDEIVNDGKGGGIASLVSLITNQRRNVTEFLMKFLEDESKADKKLASRNKKLIDAINAVEGEEPAVDDGMGGTGEVGDGGTPEEGTSEDDLNLDVDAPPLEGETPAPEEEEGEETPEGGGEQEEESEEEEDQTPTDEPVGSSDPDSPNYDPFTPGNKK